MKRTVALALLLTTIFAFPNVGAMTPAAETHWLSLINVTHDDPTDLRVLIMPPAYVATASMVWKTDWIGPNALEDHPAVQASLEAVEYWAWILDQYPNEYPNADMIGIEVAIFDEDLEPADVTKADIIINTAMSADSPIFLFHLGLGLPTWQYQVLIRNDRPQDTCTVWNTGVGTQNAKSHLSPLRLRNLVIHEFGHCLAVGHTGTSLGLSHCSNQYGCFDQHPTDVMSSVAPGHRQCISNLNVQSLDEGYAWLTDTGTWTAHDGETFMLKSDYETKCMPASMERF